MKRKSQKKNQGITLISLVITIIILLILAAITLNLTIGENGIFRKAQYAKEQYENAQEKEQKELNNLYSQMLIATNDSSQITVNIEDLRAIINEQVKNEVSQILQNGNIDYSNEGNIITSTKTVTASTNTWYSVEGPTIPAGTWLIFISSYNNSNNRWCYAGLHGTGCPHAFVDSSCNSYISTSGYYSGESTMLSAAVLNGDSSTYTYTVTFKAIKLSNTY